MKASFYKEHEYEKDSHKTLCVSPIYKEVIRMIRNVESTGGFFDGLISKMREIINIKQVNFDDVVPLHLFNVEICGKLLSFMLSSDYPPLLQRTSADFFRHILIEDEKFDKKILKKIPNLIKNISDALDEHHPCIEQLIICICYFNTTCKADRDLILKYFSVERMKSYYMYLNHLQLVFILFVESISYFPFDDMNFVSYLVQEVLSLILHVGPRDCVSTFRLFDALDHLIYNHGQDVSVIVRNTPDFLDIINQSLEAYPEIVGKETRPNQKLTFNKIKGCIYAFTSKLAVYDPALCSSIERKQYYLSMYNWKDETFKQKNFIDSVFSFIREMIAYCPGKIYSEMQMPRYKDKRGKETTSLLDVIFKMIKTGTLNSQKCGISVIVQFILYLRADQSKFNLVNRVVSYNILSHIFLLFEHDDEYLNMLAALFADQIIPVVRALGRFSDYCYVIEREMGFIMDLTLSSNRDLANLCSNILRYYECYSDITERGADNI